jgi:thimet oligopeptidase
MRLLDDVPGRIARARALQTAITTGTVPGSKVLDAYDEASATLVDGAHRAKLIQQTDPSAATRSAARQAAEELHEALLALSLDPPVYQALSAITPDDPVARHYRDRVVRDMRRNGLDRDPATRARVRELQLILHGLEQDFEDAIRSDERSAAVPAADLAGMPASYLAAHPPGPDGLVVLTTAQPDYLPIQRFCRSAAVREKMWRLFQERGRPANVPILQALLTTRLELARVLGFDSFADYAAADKMIGTSAGITAFIDSAADASKAAAAADYARLLEFSARTELDPWDVPYLIEQVRATSYGSDSRDLLPYFEFGRVKAGIMALLASLFDVHFTETSSASAWHGSVETYEVTDGSGALLAQVHLDLHPRPDKYGHAALFAMDAGKAGRRLPSCALVANFPGPGDLLMPAEVRTFLHEFGHVIHYVLAGRGRWSGLNGLTVEWDFVETPSQLLEQWLADPRTVATFAVHQETGEPLPAAAVERLRAAEAFGRGLETRRQLVLATLSHDLHSATGPSTPPSDIAAAAHRGLLPYRHVDEVWQHLSFLHLAWYSACYYTYQWSLVIAKDLFTAFAGDDPGVAHRYRDQILVPGSSAPAATLVSNFLGRSHNADAYRAWLTRPS